MKKPDPKKQQAMTEKKAETPATEKSSTPAKEAKPTETASEPPAPSTPKTSSWRKHEERMLEKQQQEKQRQLLRQQQQDLYGYTPFKAPPYPVYDQRSQTPREYSPAIRMQNLVNNYSAFRLWNATL